MARSLALFDSAQSALSLPKGGDPIAPRRSLARLPLTPPLTPAP